ncbi:DinB family protein [Rubrivirga sp. IMCC45206]|uniref:DinB family protein n=1 Tax=Rubrivirga sp. IMCC45206 TaxID=3391614 RepID=UPI00398F956C
MWYDPKSRLPRPSQLVLVLTTRGSRQAARFAVAYTEAWPQGASWVLQRSGDAVPFEDVTVWSPDVGAERPGLVDASAPMSGESAAPPPAIATEIVAEIVRTGDLLRKIPPEHLDWSPHPQVPTLRTLALRVVRIVARVGWILDLDSIELTYEPDLSELVTVDQMVTAYLANQRAVRRLAAETDGAALREPWQLERNGAVVARLARGNAVRLFGLVPVVHHRAEMAMMLTALGVRTEHPYGPWAFGDAIAAPAGWGGTLGGEAPTLLSA